MKIILYKRKNLQMKQQLRMKENKKKFFLSYLVNK